MYKEIINDSTNDWTPLCGKSFDDQLPGGWLTPDRSYQDNSIRAYRDSSEGCVLGSHREKVVNLYVSAGSRGNPGPSAVGVVILDHQNNELFHCAEYIGNGTNNQAEYKALICGLKHCRDFSSEQIQCFSDSRLVIEQVRGKWRVKKKHLKELCTKVKGFEQEFSRVTYQHLSRDNESIKRAKLLVTNVIDEKYSQDKGAKIWT